mgnify:CR=1 FL=1
MLPIFFADNGDMKKLPLFLIVLFFLVILVPQLCAQASTTASVSPEEAAKMRSQFVDYSKMFIGRPYLSGGIGPDAFDCSGLVFTCSRDSIGVQLPRKTTAIFSFCKQVSDDAREAGDLVFFKTTSSGTVSHVGIYIGNGQFIHAASDGPNTGVIISSLRENYWKGHYYRTGSFLPSSKSASTIASTAGSAGSSDAGTATVTEIEVVAEQNGGARNATSGSAASSGSANKSAKSGTAAASAKRTNASSSQSRRSSSHPFLSSVILDGSLFVDWNFFTAKNVRLNFRGASTMLHARYAGKTLQPGVGTMLRYDYGTDVFQIPIVASLSFGEYVRIFAGPVISIGSPTMPGDSDTDIKASFFPGIMGVCWQTPSFAIGKTTLSFVQDVHFTIFNRTDGAALEPIDNIAAGLVFSSGLRVTLPLRNVL